MLRQKLWRHIFLNCRTDLMTAFPRNAGTMSGYAIPLELTWKASCRSSFHVTVCWNANSASLSQFWCTVMTEYPSLSSHATQHILPFRKTYLCDSDFSTLVQLKTEHRNGVNTERDLKVALSTIKHDSVTLLNSKKTSSFPIYMPAVCLHHLLSIHVLVPFKRKWLKRHIHQQAWLGALFIKPTCFFLSLPFRTATIVLLCYWYYLAY